MHGMAARQPEDGDHPLAARHCRSNASPILWSAAARKPKASRRVATRFSAAAFTGNSPAPKMTAVWKSTSPTTTSARSASSSPRRSRALMAGGG